jgi:hypothetical protein
LFSGFLLSLIVTKSHLLIYILLILWAIKSARNSMMSISLLNLVVLINGSLLPSGGPLKALWWFAIIFCSLRILIDCTKLRYLTHPVLPSLLLFTFVVMFQSISSSVIAVSFFKIFVFMVVAASLLLGFKLTSCQGFNWTNWFLGLWISVLLLSIPAFFVKEIGFFRDPSGFQGILNHPQVFGIFSATCFAWFLGKDYLSVERSSVFFKFFLLLSLVFVFLSRARTSVVAIIIAIAILTMLSIVASHIWGRFVRKFIALLVVSSLVVFALIFVSDDWKTSALFDFMMKQSETSTVNDALKVSRGRIIQESWDTFLEYPLMGIGFGITNNEYFTLEIDARTGLPVSAATEKAMLPVVLLEETGLVGFFAFLPFIFMMIRYTFLSMDFKSPLVFLTAFLTNIGEMTFFSVGGIGLYLLILMTWSANNSYSMEKG